MQERPDDAALRLVYADWLEEQGDPRSELVRLLHILTQSVEVTDRDTLEGRLRSLVASGVQAVGPFFTNSIGMKFAWIPAGTFLMGDPREQAITGRSPRHQVTLTRGFYLGIYPVTQVVWRAVMGNNPSEFQGDDLPVDTVTWRNCQTFFRKLNKRKKHPYRLPTEAEWEYACRAGTTTAFHFGAACNGREANCDGHDPHGTQEKGPYLRKTCPVGSYAPNAFGLHDMHGNVDEWCADWYDDFYGRYPIAAATDPHGPAEGKRRVLRGGSWHFAPSYGRSGARLQQTPGRTTNMYGFRVAFQPD